MSDLNINQILPLVQMAYAEDLGDAGDVTTWATIPEDATSEASLNSRQDGIVVGVEIAQACFHHIDPDLDIILCKRDGDPVVKGETIMTLSGRSRSILTGERVALNFMGRLSGIATLTSQYATAVSHTKARICCTRKTTPGLRKLEKFAVRCGGGVNHRFGLYDAVLIKDNHIEACGTIGGAIDRAKEKAGHMVKIEVELDHLSDIQEALNHKPDVIMLDNMNPLQLAEGVAMIDGRAVVEASGSVSLDTVKDIAEAGVNLISIGRLTHSVENFDVGLDF